MEVINVCGTCKYYENYHGGFCNELATLTGVDDYCCKKYKQQEKNENDKIKE